MSRTHQLILSTQPYASIAMHELSVIFLLAPTRPCALHQDLPVHPVARIQHNARLVSVQLRADSIPIATQLYYHVVFERVAVYQPFTVVAIACTPAAVSELRTRSSEAELMPWCRL